MPTLPTSTSDYRRRLCPGALSRTAALAHTFFSRCGTGDASFPRRRRGSVPNAIATSGRDAFAVTPGFGDDTRVRLRRGEFRLEKEPAASSSSPEAVGAALDAVPTVLMLAALMSVPE